MKRARGVVLLGFAMAVVSGCGSAIPPAGNYASVSGRISDARSGAALTGATVVVNSVFSATTDATGAYRIVTVPTGGWHYRVDGPPGYGSASSDVPAPLTPGEARTLDISLSRR